MRRNGPFEWEYLNSKGNRLKADLPREFHGKDDQREPTAYGLHTAVERCKIQLEQEPPPEVRSLLENRLRLAQAQLLAHKLGEDLCQSNQAAVSASTW